MADLRRTLSDGYHHFCRSAICQPLEGHIGMGVEKPMAFAICEANQQVFAEAILFRIEN